MIDEFNKIVIEFEVFGQKENWICNVINEPFRHRYVVRNIGEFTIELLQSANSKCELLKYIDDFFKSYNYRTTKINMRYEPVKNFLFLAEGCFPTESNIENLLNKRVVVTEKVGNFSKKSVFKIKLIADSYSFHRLH